MKDRKYETMVEISKRIGDKGLKDGLDFISIRSKIEKEINNQFINKDKLKAQIKNINPCAISNNGKPLSNSFRDGETVGKNNFKCEVLKLLEE